MKTLDELEAGFPELTFIRKHYGFKVIFNTQNFPSPPTEHVYRRYSESIASLSGNAHTSRVGSRAFIVLTGSLPVVPPNPLNVIKVLRRHVPDEFLVGNNLTDAIRAMALEIKTLREQNQQAHDILCGK